MASSSGLRLRVDKPDPSIQSLCRILTRLRDGGILASQLESLILDDPLIAEQLSPPRKAHSLRIHREH